MGSVASTLLLVVGVGVLGDGVRVRVGVWTGVLGGVLEVGVLGGIPCGVLGGVVVVVVVVVVGGHGLMSDVRRQTSDVRAPGGCGVDGGWWTVVGWWTVDGWTGGRVDGWTGA